VTVGRQITAQSPTLNSDAEIARSKRLSSVPSTLRHGHVGGRRAHHGTRHTDLPRWMREGVAGAS
jgi:hypothetical protein